MEAVSIDCSFKNLNYERRKDREMIPEGKLSEDFNLIIPFKKKGKRKGLLIF